MSGEDLPSFLSPHCSASSQDWRHNVDHNVIRKFNFTDKTMESFNSYSSTEPGTIKVYLRLRPHTFSEHQSDCFLVDSSRTTLTTFCPSNFGVVKQIKNKPKHNKYTFNYIFSPNDTQSEVFQKVVRKPVEDFLYGQSSLLFAYGTTCSGKTFTIQGSCSQPGIIPRSLILIFKSLKTLSVKSAGNSGRYLHPHQWDGVISLSEEDGLSAQNFKTKILTSHSAPRNQVSNKSSKCKFQTHYFEQDDSLEESWYMDFREKLMEEMKEVDFSRFESPNYSVWVAFYEIHNETIYDLLETQPQKIPLRTAMDQNNRWYIRGLHYVEVKSDVEAYKVFLFGKKNRTVASTMLNKSSSRSHAIFNIKLAFHSEVLKVTSFTICDLAGTESQKKAMNSGANLKESQRINLSHMMLNMCFRIIRENQTKSEKQVIPFRGSKLTQLFQQALSGGESTTMIANINQDPVLFEETQVVLRSSAIAHRIVTEVEKPRICHSRRQSVYLTGYNKLHSTGGSSQFQQKYETKGEPLLGSLAEEKIKETEEVSRLKREVSRLTVALAEQESNIRKELYEEFESMTEEMTQGEKKMRMMVRERYERSIRYLLDKLNKRTPTSMSSAFSNPENSFTVSQNSVLSAEMDRLKETLSEETMKRCEAENLVSELRIKLSGSNQEKENLQSLIKEYGELLEKGKEEIEELRDKIEELEKTEEENAQLLDVKESEIVNLKKEVYDLTMFLSQEKQSDDIAEYEEDLKMGTKVMNEMREKLDELVQENEEYSKCLVEKVAENAKLMERIEKLVSEKEQLAETLKRHKEPRTNYKLKKIKTEPIEVDLSKVKKEKIDDSDLSERGPTPRCSNRVQEERSLSSFGESGNDGVSQTVPLPLLNKKDEVLHSCSEGQEHDVNLLQETANKPKESNLINQEISETSKTAKESPKEEGVKFKCEETEEVGAKINKLIDKDKEDNGFNSCSEGQENQVYILKDVGLVTEENSVMASRKEKTPRKKGDVPNNECKETEEVSATVNNVVIKIEEDARVNSCSEGNGVNGLVDRLVNIQKDADLLNKDNPVTTSSKKKTSRKKDKSLNKECKENEVNTSVDKVKEVLDCCPERQENEVGLIQNGAKKQTDTDLLNEDNWGTIPKKRKPLKKDKLLNDEHKENSVGYTPGRLRTSSRKPRKPFSPLKKHNFADGDSFKDTEEEIVDSDDDFVPTISRLTSTKKKQPKKKIQEIPASPCKIEENGDCLLNLKKGESKVRHRLFTPSDALASTDPFEVSLNLSTQQVSPRTMVKQLRTGKKY